MTTLASLQSGSCVIKYTAIIEGVPYIFSDCDNEASVQAAHDLGVSSEFDTATLIPGLIVNLKNSQSIKPWEAFSSSGRCTLRIVDYDGSDTFGTYISKRATGAETSLTETIDRNDTTINVKSTTNFASSGYIFIGTECIKYTGKTSTSFTGCTRGYFSPFQCASSGSGTIRFGNHHRVARDPNHVQINPVVTQLPRIWMGKRVAVWMHAYDPVTETLDVRSDAQLVYAGRIVGIADDPDTFHTVIEIGHVIDTDAKNAVIGKDMWSAEMSDGLYIPAGRTFSFEDQKSGYALRQADDLTVVASGASGTNEINAGRYSLSELCEKLNIWMAGELTAGRIYGYYSWASPVTTNNGLRTVCTWRIEDASSVICLWRLWLPGEICAFLGLTATEPGLGKQRERIYGGNGTTTNVDHAFQGSSVPFANIVFRPLSPGRVGQEFASESVNYEVENERGSFIDQYSLLPASIKGACSSSSQWGLFLLDEKILMVGSYSSSTLYNCWLAPLQRASDTSTSALSYVGRRADEDGSPVTLRQVFLLESTLAQMLLTLAYSTGTSGYNHSTYDTLGYGLGWNIPGELLGPEFEYSVTNMPGANSPIVVLIDEPTPFVGLLGDDLVFRRSFARWKNQHIEFAQWQTPLASNAALSSDGTSLALTESNKASPAGTQDNHRTATQETDEHVKPIIKIDYCRDFGTDRGSKYLKSVSTEDQSAVDDAGGGVPSYTIKLRNTFGQFANTGAAVESLLPDFIAFLPVMSKGREMVRSIDMRYWEGYSVGDVAIVTDSFARDPLTGRRGISARPAVITRITYDPGGYTGGGDSQAMSGEVELMFLDVHRGDLYAPSAQVDDTATNAGYDAGTYTLTCYEHKYSHVLSLPRIRGLTANIAEAADASNFLPGDKILIIEIDPANPASPDYWERTVSSQSGNTIVLTSALSAPAWSASKKYRITYQKYSQVQTSQQDYAFQADDTDEMTEDLEVPSHYSVEPETWGFNANAAPPVSALVPTLVAGDGRAYDVGHDRQIVDNINNIIDYKTSHQAPCLWNEYADDTSNSADYYTLWMGVVFLGTEHMTASVKRQITIAPWFRSSSGGNTGYIRVTLSDKPPVSSSTTGGDTLVDGARFVGNYVQAEWSTTSSTWTTGAETAVDLNCKNIFFGYVFVVIEKKGYGQTRGLAKFSEGPRTTS